MQLHGGGAHDPRAPSPLRMPLGVDGLHRCH